MVSIGLQVNSAGMQMMVLAWVVSKGAGGASSLSPHHERMFDVFRCA